VFVCTKFAWNGEIVTFGASQDEITDEVGYFGEEERSGVEWSGVKRRRKRRRRRRGVYLGIQ